MQAYMCFVVLVGSTGWAVEQTENATSLINANISLLSNETLEPTNYTSYESNPTQESTNNDTQQVTNNLTQGITNNLTQESTPNNDTEELPMNFTQEEKFSYNGTDLTNNSTECYMKMVNITLQCQNETGASEDDANTAIRMEIPSSDAGKCLMRCLLKTRGWMTPEGLFSPNVTASYLTRVHKDPELEPEFIKLGEFCYDKLKTQPIENIDTCQFAYDIAVCCDEYHKTMFPVQRPNSPPVNAITVP